MMLNLTLGLSSRVSFNKKTIGNGIGMRFNDNDEYRPVINEILEGNLLTAARLEEVMKKTKFIKRILNFFMPSKQHFIIMEWVGFFLYKLLERREPLIFPSRLQPNQNTLKFERRLKSALFFPRSLLHVRSHLRREQG